MTSPPGRDGDGCRPDIAPGRTTRESLGSRTTELEDQATTSGTLQPVALVAVAAGACPLAGCGKAETGGGSAASGELTLWTHNAGNKAELGGDHADRQRLQRQPDQVQGQGPGLPAGLLQPVGRRRGGRQEAALHPGHRRPERAELGVGRLSGPADRPGRHAVASTCRARSASTTTRSTPTATTTSRWPCSRASRSWSKYGIRIPTDRPAVDGGRVQRRAGEDQGGRQVPDTRWTSATGDTGEWWPYAYSPFLQSFGGDLINRNDYKSADGVAQRAAGRRRGRPGSAGLVTDGYMPAKSGTDAGRTSSTARPRSSGNGIWSAGDTAQGVRRRRRVPAAAGLRQRPEDRWRFVAVGHQRRTARTRRGAHGLPEVRAPGQVRRAVSRRDHGHHPGHRRRGRAWSRATRPGGQNDIFRRSSKKFAVVRPVTPGLPVHRDRRSPRPRRTSSNGADPQAGARPGRQGHRRQPEVQRLLPVS